MTKVNSDFDIYWLLAADRRGEHLFASIAPNPRAMCALHNN